MKVSPSSKVVGDMALMMVAQDLSKEDVLDPSRDIAFPASVVEMLRGDLGQPPGGWPEDLRKKALNGQAPIIVRPDALLAETDLEASRQSAEKKCGRNLSDEEFPAYLMYPKIFVDYVGAVRKYGPVSKLATRTYFYGMQPGEEISIEIEAGKSLVVRLLTLGEMDEDGQVKVFFEPNGQPRTVRVPNRSAAALRATRRKVDENDPGQIGSPMASSIATIAVRAGDPVKSGDLLVTLEAMKMETALRAPIDGRVKEILVAPGAHVEAKDLLLILSSE